jgi:hypothetical protein
MYHEVHKVFKIAKMLKSYSNNGFLLDGFIQGYRRYFS